MSAFSKSTWDLIQNLVLNLFYDDGEGYIDLERDKVYQFDEEGNLLSENDRTWLAINGQPVAYYFLEEDEETGTITRRVPTLHNGQRMNLIPVFDEKNPYGYIAGAQTDYDAEVTYLSVFSITSVITHPPSTNSKPNGLKPPLF